MYIYFLHVYLCNYIITSLIYNLAIFTKIGAIEIPPQDYQDKLLSPLRSFVGIHPVS